MYCPTMPQTVLQQWEQDAGPFGDAPATRSWLPALDIHSGVTKQQLSIRQELASYTGVKYAYVNRIATCGATIFPEVGYVKPVEGDEELMIEPRERQRMLQAAGVYMRSDENWVVLKQHRLIDLLHNPTPGERDSSWTQFAFELHLFWQLCGEVWIWMVPDQLFGLPVALWVIPNDMIRPVIERKRNGSIVEFYEIVDATGEVMHKVPVDQIMRGRDKSPLDKNGCYSSTQAGAAWLKSAEAIDFAQYSSFATDIYSDFAVLLDAEVHPHPNRDDLDLLKEVFMARAAGLGNKGALLLPPGIQELKKLRDKPMEMDYKESGGLVRDNIGSTHGMNKFSIGITEDMNRGDTQEVQVAFWTMVGDPRNVFVADMLTTQLARKFDERIIICFPSGRPIDPEQVRLDDALDWQCGALTPDDRRRARGRKPFGETWSQIGYISSSLVPLDMTGEVIETGLEAAKMAATQPDDGTDDGDANDGNKPGASDGRAKKVEKKAAVAKDE